MWAAGRGDGGDGLSLGREVSVQERQLLADTGQDRQAQGQSRQQSSTLSSRNKTYGEKESYIIIIIKHSLYSAIPHLNVWAQRALQKH